MSGPDPTTFMAILVIALALIVWWRATLLIVVLFLISVLVFGLNEVMERIDLRSSAETITGPTDGPPIGDDGTLGQMTWVSSSGSMARAMFRRRRRETRGTGGARASGTTHRALPARAGRGTAR